MALFLDLDISYGLVDMNECIYKLVVKLLIDSIIMPNKFEFPDTTFFYICLRVLSLVFSRQIPALYISLIRVVLITNKLASCKVPDYLFNISTNYLLSTYL